MLRQVDDSTRCLEADRLLSEYLVVVAKSARQFKLLALHGAMEAARAGARGDAIVVAGGGAEFRVVALEVRRLAVSLAKATEDISRTVDGARRSLQSLHAAASEGQRHVEAAQGANFVRCDRAGPRHDRGIGSPRGRRGARRGRNGADDPNECDSRAFGWRGQGNWRRCRSPGDAGPIPVRR